MTEIRKTEEQAGRAPSTRCRASCRMKVQGPWSKVQEKLLLLSFKVSHSTCHGGLYFLLDVPLSRVGMRTPTGLLPTRGQHPWNSSQAPPLPLRPQSQPTANPRTLLLCAGMPQVPRQGWARGCWVAPKHVGGWDSQFCALSWDTTVWMCPTQTLAALLPKIPPLETGGGTVTGNGEKRPLALGDRSSRLTTCPRDARNGGEGHDGGWANAHAPLPHRTSLTKHRFKDKTVQNFKTTDAEH